MNKSVTLTDGQWSFLCSTLADTIAKYEKELQDPKIVPEDTEAFQGLIADSKDIWVQINQQTGEGC